MKRYYLIMIIPFFLAGCVNERGISLKYYNNCEEYYDVQGYYHKRCDKNLIEYKEVINTDTGTVEGKIR